VDKFDGPILFATFLLGLAIALAFPMFLLWIKTKKMREEQYIRDLSLASKPVSSHYHVYSEF
jgi:hypothetical protein